MRTLVDIPRTDIEKLDRLAKQGGASRAALIRSAISDYVQKNAALSSDEAFGLWGEDGEDGLAFQLRIRSEW